MSQPTRSNPINGFMGLAVMEVLPAGSQYLCGLLRCAGSSGTTWFEELVRGGKVPMCVEVPPLSVDGSDESDKVFHAPVYWLNFEIDGTLRNVVASLPALIETDHPYLTEERYTDYGSMLHTVRVRVGKLHLTHCSPSCHEPGEFVSTVQPLHLIVSIERPLSAPTAPTSADMFDQVGLGFASSNDTLLSVDLSHMAPYVRSIRSFLSYCSQVTAAPDVSRLRNIVNIDSSFLYYCPTLSGTLDLSFLVALTSVGDHFVGKTSLSSIILPPSLAFIGKGFLEKSDLLKQIDLNPLRHLTKIPDNFMAECSALVEIDLSPLSQVTSIGGYFLVGSSNLTALDTSVLTCLKSVGTSFACSSGLKSINLEGFRWSPTSHVSELESSFLSHCCNLTSVDLAPLCQVNRIGRAFMACCSNVSTVDMSMMTQVGSIGDGLFSGCINITTLDLSTLPMSKNSTMYIFEGCTSLKTVIVTKSKCHGPSLGRLERACASVGAKCIVK